MHTEIQVTPPTSTKRDYWQSHIKQWNESQLTQQSYCEKVGINYGTFVHWRCVLRKELSGLKQPKFVAVKTISTPLSSDAPRAIQVKLTSGHIVYIPTAMDVKEIAALINLLGHAHA